MFILKGPDLYDRLFDRTCLQPVLFLSQNSNIVVVVVFPIGFKVIVELGICRLVRELMITKLIVLLPRFFLLI